MKGKELFYLTTHSNTFYLQLYSIRYMKNYMIARTVTCWNHSIGYSFQIAARYILRKEQFDLTTQSNTFYLQLYRIRYIKNYMMAITVTCWNHSMGYSFQVATKYILRKEGTVWFNNTIQHILFTVIQHQIYHVTMQVAARDLLNAPSHRQVSICHGFWHWLWSTGWNEK